MNENVDNIARNLNKISFSYLMQDFSLNEILDKKDINGWNLLHWAVADLDVNKISEYLSHNVPFDSLTHNNLIPLDALKFKKNEENPQSSIIPFNEGGFTPIHLCVFLHKRYVVEDQFSSQGYSDKIDKILDMFIKDIEQFKNIEDKMGLSFTDYIFICENFKSLIKLLHLDKELQTLKKITPQTAIKIIERMLINEKNGLNQNRDMITLEESVDIIKKCILKDEVSGKLGVNTKSRKMVKI